MERKPVKSSQIKSIGYNQAALMLEVEFTSAGNPVYQYQNVPPKLHKDLMAAESVGSFFIREIKKRPSSFPCVRVEAVESEVKPEVPEAEWDEERSEPQTGITHLPGSVRAALTRRGTDIVTRAQNLTIDSNGTYVTAAEMLKGIKSLQAEVDGAHDPVIQHWYLKHKAALADKSTDSQPLVDAEKIIKGKLLVWKQECDRKDREEADKRQREEEERIRNQAHEENLKEAQRLADLGDMDGAAAAIDAPFEVPTVPVKVERTLPTVKGISQRKRYVVAEVKLMELVKAVAAGKAPVECLTSNDKFLGKQASAFQKVGEIYPGVLVREDEGIGAGRA